MAKNPNKGVKASDLPVMKSMCKSCPFNLVAHNLYKDIQLANKVTERTLFQGHQICHGTEGENGEWTHRCKGSFDHNMVVYTRLGLEKLVK